MTTPSGGSGRTAPAGTELSAALLDVLTDGVIVVRDGFVIYPNRTAVRMLRCHDGQELFWRPVEEVIHPSEQARIAELLAGPADPAAPGCELRMVGRTGRLVPVEARVVPLQFEGAPAAALVLRDLSERRRHERQLRFNDRMASMGTLAAGVAHEINNPLTYVLANMEQMAEICADPARLDDDAGRAELLELLGEARDGASRVEAIIRELRRFARKPDERQVQDVDIEPLIESVLRMARSQICDRATLVRELAPTPPVRSNPIQLHQVLLNLIFNAAQAIPEGEVERNEIRVATNVDASGQVLIEVSDTGAGIAPAALERIFDPFYTSSPFGAGGGLGLWITHSIVTSLGGEIAVDSILGRGTTFRVTLPV
ncbi:MAG TPA: ATP-binding protein, partial [Kofleriaceae bacterium]|nr:ATP-binding protein [Kofleriaceae bacterium]